MHKFYCGWGYWSWRTWQGRTLRFGNQVPREGGVSTQHSGTHTLWGNLKDWICDLCAGRIGFPMKIQGFWTTAYLSICSGVWIWQMLISAQSLLPLWISVAYEGQSDWRQLCPQNPSEQVVPKLLIRLLSHIFINFFLNGLKIIMGNTSFRWNNSFRYFISVCLVCLKINNVVLCRKNKAEYCFSKGKLCYGEKWMIYIFKPPFVVLQFRSQNCIVV